jgi:hypothetical protein
MGLAELYAEDAAPMPDMTRARGLDADLGANGPASLARPWRLVVYEQRISPTRSVLARRMVYADTTAIDALHNAAAITDRQHRAGCRLYGLFLAAGLSPRSTARLDTLREAVEEYSLEDDTGEPIEDARVAYRRLLRDAGPVLGPVLDALMHASRVSLPQARDGLDYLAGFWGFGED